MQISIQRPEMFAFSEYWKGRIAVLKGWIYQLTLLPETYGNIWSASTAALSSRTNNKPTVFSCWFKGHNFRV